jgi:hypothetical protein
MNIWGIEEHRGDGRSCPITPVHLPWPKRIFLFFFRFGLCPLCVTMSVGYCFVRTFRTIIRGLGCNAPRIQEVRSRKPANDLGQTKQVLQLIRER